MRRPSPVGSGESGPDPAGLWRAGKHKLSREEGAEGLLPARDFGGSRFILTGVLQEGAASLLYTGERGRLVSLAASNLEGILRGFKLLPEAAWKGSGLPFTVMSPAPALP